MFARIALAHRVVVVCLAGVALVAGCGSPTATPNTSATGLKDSGVTGLDTQLTDQADAPAPGDITTDVPIDGTIGSDGEDAACTGTEGCACSADTDCKVGTCQGADGKKVCTAPCKPTEPATEVCDGVDNDCNGKTDEATCDDANPCTVDLCNATTPTQADTTCTHSADTAASPCDDKNACTDKDVCAGGACAGVKTACDDSNPCTDDSCDPAKGCAHDANKAACDDANACTQNDTCKDTACAGGSATVCDDNNQCTTDACDIAVGCTATAITGACNDGSACTEGDACSDGKCAPGKPIECNDANPCTDDVCDPSVGCTTTTNDVACDDGSLCSAGDKCAGGKCVGGAAIKCDDGNACTDDSCDMAMGCTVTDNTTKCDDGSKCTDNDACAAGKCEGSNVICNDNNACTNDACDPAAGCTVTNNEGAGCDDGNACTLSDYCAGDKCSGGAAKSCDDGKPCTDDTCDAKLGCGNANNTTTCDDDDKCTGGDACKDGACAGGPAIVCDDNNQCTTDSCDAKTGCVSTPTDGACEDGDACTSGDKCGKATCVGGGATVCNDSNVCTDDSCDPKSGCVFAKNSIPCDDGNACTLGDTCIAGACPAGVGTPVCEDNNPCTTDSCDPKSGCVFANTTAGCSDGDACTDKDLCAGGKCVPGLALVCNDNNPCTDDVCDPAKGCVHLNNDKPCEDGNLCTDKDACTGGKCVPGAVLVCDDKNPCSDDKCDGAKGCVFANDDLNVCSDNNSCTVGDACKAGVCTGIGKTCDDANPCTDDSCANNLCSNVNNVKPCTDGNACTASDACAAGKCVAGAAKLCDDGTGCTSAPKCTALPYALPFNCGDVSLATWTMTPAIAGLGWAFDDSPNPPGSKTAPCSLNFNNGKDFSCPVGAKSVLGGYATSPVFNASAIKPGTPTTLRFQLAGNWENGEFDNLDLETTIDGGKSWQLFKTYDAWTVPSWNPVSADLTALDGKVFQVRFRFSTTDCQFNDGVGPFIDSFSIATGLCKDALQCNDGNACTDDVCELATGKCTYKNNAAACDDGNVCSEKDICSAGLCQKGATPKKCDDGNVCTDDACDALKGCSNVNNVAICTDGNACTDGDKCALGKCGAGPAKVCDDNNVCTDDSCNSLVGCKVTNKDGSGAPACDGTVVNGRCYKAFKASKNWKDAEAGCVIWGGGAHLASVANLTENTDVRKVTDATCGAGSDTWLGGFSSANVWTWSDKTVFKYTNWQAGEPNNLLTEHAIMMYGGGTWNNYIEGNTLGCYTCDRIAPPTCSDASACTTVDICDGAAKCIGSVPPNCDDGNPCTNDACDVKLGCTHTNNILACNDANACTDKDVCNAGKCAGAAKVCDDLNVCTNDGCDVKAGCTVAVKPGAGVPACDGTTSGGRCYKAYKDAKTWVNAEAACKAWGGGAHLTGIASLAENGIVRGVANGVCGVNATTAIGLSDAASEGKYAWLDGTASTYFNWLGGQPDNSANEDYVGMWDSPSWNDFNGSWVFPCYVCERTAPTILCDDGNACTTADVCDATGKCTGSIAPNCDDGNVCTNDACSIKAGCTHVANTAPCTDDNACSVGDICAASKCAPGTTKLVCDDKNVCTADSCNPASGCVYTPVVGAACNDGNACTTVDKCDIKAKCIGSTPPTCNDNNVCSVDSCDPAKGCVATTAHDRCVAGDKLAPTCSTCVKDICAADSFCCSTGWDSACVGAVRTVCASVACDPKGSCSHSMCATGGTLAKGCDAPTNSCVTKICTVDSWCCANSWDDTCVNEVATICKLSCK